MSDLVLLLSTLPLLRHVSISRGISRVQTKKTSNCLFPGKDLVGREHQRANLEQPSKQFRLNLDFILLSLFLWHCWGLISYFEYLGTLGTKPSIKTTCRWAAERKLPIMAVTASLDRPSCQNWFKCTARAESHVKKQHETSAYTCRFLMTLPNENLSWHSHAQQHILPQPFLIGIALTPSSCDCCSACYCIQCLSLLFQQLYHGLPLRWLATRQDRGGEGNETGSHLHSTNITTFLRIYMRKSDDSHGVSAALQPAFSSSWATKWPLAIQQSVQLLGQSDPSLPLCVGSNWIQSSLISFRFIPVIFEPLSSKK